MVVGRVVRFDEVRGYGFAAPESGGDDVFVHANDLKVEKRLIVAGTLIEFDVEEGDRGPFATNIHLAKSDAVVRPELADDTLSDVLSPQEFLHEITETMLHDVPTLTGQQILALRQSLARLAHSHGWLDS